MRAAENEIETLTVEDVLSVHKNQRIVLVDIRDIRELWRDGAIQVQFTLQEEC